MTIPNPSATHSTLPQNLQARMEALAEQSQGDSGLLVEEAVQQYVVQKEKARAALLHEAHASWQEFQETGEYISWEDTRKWMESWATENELPLPSCCVFSRP